MACSKESGLDLEGVDFKRSGDVVVVFAHPALKQSILMREAGIKDCLSKAGFRIQRII